jgi:hypothetical protein
MQPARRVHGSALSRRQRASTPPKPEAAWTHLSDEDLLGVRICDLGVSLRGTVLEGRIARLHRELEDRGLALRPRCYLADEWMCPDGETAIGIPFFLAHPRLQSLEFRMMFEVEGGSPSWCMRLLRHEAGHAFDHAYRLHRRPDWRRVFGSPNVQYNPYFYPIDPVSRNHVRNVPDNYAQSHPFEDFAETFAVWLNPASQWRTRYAGWPAMRKLRCVDRIMREIARRSPPRRKPRLPSRASLLQSTLRSYYERKFRLYQLGDLSFCVRELRTMFGASRGKKPARTAAALIRRHKRVIVDSVSEWSGDRSRHVSQVVASLARLCDENRLVVRDDPSAALVRFSTYVAALIVNRLRAHTYRLRR